MRYHGRSAGLALALVVAAAITGCEGVPGNFPGGTHASIDKFVYPSTSELPQTVAIVDTRTGETVWSKDIPVGRQLVIRFYAERSDDPAFPDRMDWQLMQQRQGGATLSNHVYVPPANARRIETSFRAPGEMPDAAAAESAPASAAESTPTEAAQPALSEQTPIDTAPTDAPEPGAGATPDTPPTPPAEPKPSDTPPVDIPERG